MKYALAVAVLLAMFLGVGCGTARIVVRSTVLSSGEVDQEFTIRGQGPIGEAIKDSYRLDDLRKTGWKADQSAEGSGYVVRMSKRLKQGDAWLPTSASGSAAGGISSDTKVDFKITEGLLDREYRLRITVPPGKYQPSGQPAAEIDKQMAQAGDEIIRGMFSMAWSIILPGEVVETNADNRTARGASWEIGLDRMQKGFEMTLVGRERRDMTPVVGAGALVLVVLVFGVAKIRSRHP